MEKKGIAADSSFFICYADDINQCDMLYNFVKLYDIYIGEKILDETKKIFNKLNLLSSINVINVRYYELIKPFFGRNQKHLCDGEYEAIGISLYLYDKNILKFLIIDDKTPKKFVMNHFPELTQFLVGNIGFIKTCCLIDKTISKDEALKILEAIKENIGKIKEKRPCSMSLKDRDTILIPIIEIIKGENV